MAEITSAIGGSIPNPNFFNVFVFITTPKRYELLCKYKTKIGKHQISKKHFTMCIRTSMLKYLHSLSKKISFENGVLIYSFWSGYKDTKDMQRFLSECKNLGLKIKTLHTSGHADKDAILKLIKTVNPNKIIPIHTENAEWFNRLI